MNTPVIEPNQFLKQLYTWSRSACHEQWTPDMCDKCVLNKECNGLLEAAARLRHQNSEE